MPNAISITKAQLEQLATLSKSEQPIEAVALLLGKEGRVVKIEAMRNADSSRISFSIDPTDLISIYAKAEKNGLEITGIFHSHPGEAEPSPKDLAYMELNPVVWIIYSNTGKEFRAYLFDNRLLPVAIEVI